MSKPRYGWWPYVKDMIRRWPKLREQYRDLHSTSMAASYSGMPHGSEPSRTVEVNAIRELPSNAQREYEAVRRAIDHTERYSNGRDRLAVIDMVLWKRTHTLEGAALMVPCSIATAKRWHAEFIRMVGSCYGLMD